MLFAIALIGALSAVSFGQTPPVWSPEGCGRSKYPDAGETQNLPYMIVGGIQARPNELPWQASVRRAGTNSHFCGGIVINKEWVMCAAHCMVGETPARVSIVVGDHTRSAASSIRQTLDVTAIFNHPNYNGNTFQNDISLIKVSAMSLNENVFPVCAPQPGNQYEHLKSQCSGWGTLSSGGACCPDTLQYVVMNITTNTYCNTAYPQYQIYADMICATDNTGSRERDSCQGDSGGPLTIKEADGTFRVVGIVSWGIGCASGYPGVYSRVTSNLDWVAGIINNN